MPLWSHKNLLNMPHITLECTSNVEMDFQQFFKDLTEQIVETGHAKRLGMKCRLLVSNVFYIADGNPDLKMANLLFRLREGRSEAVRIRFSQIGIDLLSHYLEKDIAAKKIIYSTEVKELKHGLDITKSSID